MEALEGIEETEELGRGISSSQDAKRYKKSRSKHTAFLPRKGVVDISVDRLSAAGIVEATTIADNRDAVRYRKFYGWLVVVAKDAAREGRRAVASPTESNPYHADIVLPHSAATDRDEQNQHAQDLADSSYWLNATR
jgi:hypothetical protein